jgi:hypothetical protein
MNRLEAKERSCCRRAHGTAGFTNGTSRRTAGASNRRHICAPAPDLSSGQAAAAITRIDEPANAFALAASDSGD